jgi:hypothetical protein
MRTTARRIKRLKKSTATNRIKPCTDRYTLVAALRDAQRLAVTAAIGSSENGKISILGAFFEFFMNYIIGIVLD